MSFITICILINRKVTLLNTSIFLIVYYTTLSFATLIKWQRFKSSLYTTNIFFHYTKNILWRPRKLHCIYILEYLQRLYLQYLILLHLQIVINKPTNQYGIIHYMYIGTTQKSLWDLTLIYSREQRDLVMVKQRQLNLRSMTLWRSISLQSSKRSLKLDYAVYTF